MTASQPYTQISGPNGQPRTDMVLRVADGAYVPNAAGNMDWLAYQTWCAGGGTPNPPPSPSQTTTTTIAVPPSTS